jgi:two-component system, chemotaxis family, sensor kinase CheA
MTTILIAEDNRDCRELLTIALSHLGYDTIAANSGEKAIDAALAHLPDVILMDINLEGVNGIDATAAIKAHPLTSRIPVIGVSAWPGEAYRRKALEAGMAIYLTKPAPVETIKQSIQHALQLANEVGVQ